MTKPCKGTGAFSTFKVAVLLTCYNGEKFIESQILSILNQSLCDIKIFVSDDQSSDSTLQVLANLVSRFPGKIYSSVTEDRKRSAGKNFYELIEKSACIGYDYVAFSDQDDLWEKDHLISAIKICASKSCDAVSSNVIAFFPDARSKLYRKNQPQKKYDFFFESPGPGCTFVLTGALYQYIRKIFNSNRELVCNVFHHDWLIYAVARSGGFKWFIREAPLVRYRQHGNNETGARIGWKGAYVRFKKISSGWYSDQIHNVALVVRASGVMVADPILECLVTRNNWWRILTQFNQSRRSSSDRLVFFLALLFGWIK